MTNELICPSCNSRHAVMTADTYKGRIVMRCLNCDHKYTESVKNGEK